MTYFNDVAFTISGYIWIPYVLLLGYLYYEHFAASHTYFSPQNTIILWLLLSALMRCVWFNFYTCCNSLTYLVVINRVSILMQFTAISILMLMWGRAVIISKLTDKEYSNSLRNMSSSRTDQGKESPNTAALRDAASAGGAAAAASGSDADNITHRIRSMRLANQSVLQRCEKENLFRGYFRALVVINVCVWAALLGSVGDGEAVYDVNIMLVATVCAIEAVIIFSVGLRISVTLLHALNPVFMSNDSSALYTQRQQEHSGSKGTLHWWWRLAGRRCCGGCCAELSELCKLLFFWDRHRRGLHMQREVLKVILSVSTVCSIFFLVRSVGFMYRPIVEVLADYHSGSGLFGRIFYPFLFYQVPDLIPALAIALGISPPHGVMRVAAAWASDCAHYCATYAVCICFCIRPADQESYAAHHHRRTQQQLASVANRRKRGSRRIPSGIPTGGGGGGSGGRGGVEGSQPRRVRIADASLNSSSSKSGGSSQPGSRHSEQGRRVVSGATAASASSSGVQGEGAGDDFYAEEVGSYYDEADGEDGVYYDGEEEEYEDDIREGPTSSIYIIDRLSSFLRGSSIGGQGQGQGRSSEEGDAASAAAAAGAASATSANTAANASARASPVPGTISPMHQQRAGRHSYTVSGRSSTSASTGAGSSFGPAGAPWGLARESSVRSSDSAISASSSPSQQRPDSELGALGMQGSAGKRGWQGWQTQQQRREELQIEELLYQTNSSSLASSRNTSTSTSAFGLSLSFNVSSNIGGGGSGARSRRDRGVSQDLEMRASQAIPAPRLSAVARAGSRANSSASTGSGVNTNSNTNSNTLSSASSKGFGPLRGLIFPNKDIRSRTGGDADTDNDYTGPEKCISSCNSSNIISGGDPSHIPAAPGDIPAAPDIQANV